MYNEIQLAAFVMYFNNSIKRGNMLNLLGIDLSIRWNPTDLGVKYTAYTGTKEFANFLRAVADWVEATPQHVEKPFVKKKRGRESEVEQLQLTEGED